MASELSVTPLSYIGTNGIFVTDIADIDDANVIDIYEADASTIAKDDLQRAANVIGINEADADTTAENNLQSAF